MLSHETWAADAGVLGCASACCVSESACDSMTQSPEKGTWGRPGFRSRRRPRAPRSAGAPGTTLGPLTRVTSISALGLFERLAQRGTDLQDILALQLVHRGVGDPHLAVDAQVNRALQVAADLGSRLNGMPYGLRRSRQVCLARTKHTTARVATSTRPQAAYRLVSPSRNPSETAAPTTTPNHQGSASAARSSVNVPGWEGTTGGSPAQPSARATATAMSTKSDARGSVSGGSGTGRGRTWATSRCGVARALRPRCRRCRSLREPATPRAERPLSRRRREGSG